MQVDALVRGITYKTFLCKDLEEFEIDELSKVLSTSSSICRLNEKQSIAVSCWVSPKRTRSYPYARVYDTLGFGGKKATIIPFVKDEGKRGDRDFLQWDTVALMGLLGIYVIPGYYSEAEKHPRLVDKITNQKFDEQYIRSEIDALQHYHSSALHWNLEQFEKIGLVGELAMVSYERISKSLGVEMHDPKGLSDRLRVASSSKDTFLEQSRTRSKLAQKREAQSFQTREVFSGTKGSITIHDLVGGVYHLTSDDCSIVDDSIVLTESKHSSTAGFPGVDDIKDGLLKIALFCNLTKLSFEAKGFDCIPRLRLSCDSKYDTLRKREKDLLRLVQTEAVENNFELDVTEIYGAQSL